ncbi:MAG TPA: AarF/ABC1/UbiB kinase family protein [Patescibacteria group bacterium]|nr:AarF/ABC1/UbiB kinase family protein [Patescibacteria group bacterium]
MATRTKSSIAAIKRRRTARLAKLLTRVYYLHRRKRYEEMSTLVCEEFVSFGGVYIKFLQGVMLQSAMVKQWQNPDKMKIFETVDIEPLDISEILKHELGPAQLSQIALVQPQPFAAGSFGQVYYGQLTNGQAIIIKVLRPMIRELLRYDLKLLSNFSKSFFARTYSMEANINDVIREFRVATLRETDYIAEAAFANELYEAYKDHPGLVIPKTYTDLCTDHIIVQDYVEGVSAAQLIKLQEQGVDPKTYVHETLGSDLDQQLFTLGYEMLNGVFNLPRIQGDPHPGNVRLMTGNRVGLIDFGISATSPSNKSAFYGILKEWNRMYQGEQDVATLFEQFIRFFVSDLYWALEKLATFNPDKLADNANFTKEVGKVAQEAFSRVAGTDDIRPMLENGKIMQIINKTVNQGNRFGFVVKIESSEILRASQTYLTLIETLGRRETVLPSVFRHVVEQAAITHPELLEPPTNTMGVNRAIEIVSNWLERVAVRDPKLFQELMGRIKLKTGRSKTKERSHV